MPARFCHECGAQTHEEAKFCAQCGAGLGAAGGSGAARSVRPTLLGGLVLGGFTIVGLGIWAAILTPDAPAPRPGQIAANAPQGAPPGAAPAAPANPHELPGEITKLVGDLAAKAEAKPDDLDLWMHLGEVYYRTSQFDPAYRTKALAAFDHVLDRDPKRIDAVRGKGNIYYDQQNAPKAIEHFERYLEAQPKDSAVRTDLATMYLGDGQRDRAMGLYRAVIADDPDFMQAHYNLAAALHGEGDTEGALAELHIARRLTTDESLQKRIDALVARLSGNDAPAPTAPAAEPTPPAAAEQTPFQAAVEASFRAHDIIGPRIASIEWTGPGATRLLMRGFPMEAMPPMAREKFESRVRETLAQAAAAHPVTGEQSVTLVDADSGREMATLRP